MANDIGRVVTREFPYPIAHSYWQMERAARRGTYQRQFSHLLDTFEITVRFLSTVVLNNYAKDGAFDAEWNTRLNEMFDKPLTLGAWVVILQETTRRYASALISTKNFFLHLSIEVDDVQKEHPMLICKDNSKQQLLIYPLFYFYDDPMNRRMELYLYDGLERKKGNVKRLDFLNVRDGKKIPVTETVDNVDLRELFDAFRRIMEILLSGEFAPRKEAVVPEKEYYLNQQSLIASYTACFIGRDDVFSRIDEFIKEKPCGYFLLKGEPGIGKSALMANLVKRNNYTCHFIKPEGSANYPKVYTQSLYAQLIKKYGDERAIPESEEELRRSLVNYIAEISYSKLKHGQKEVVVIDGLDELALKDEIKLEFLPQGK